MVILSAIALPVLLGVGALALDVSHLYVLRNKLQSAADASALAGLNAVLAENEASPECQGGESGMVERVTNCAVTFADRNMPFDVHGSVLLPENIAFGRWVAGEPPPALLLAQCPDSSRLSDHIPLAGYFEPWHADVGWDIAQADAVQVQTFRQEASGNPVRLTLASAINRRFADVGACAVAAHVQVPLQDFCALALDDVESSIRIDGSVNVNSSGCRLATNSTHDDSVTVAGDAGNITFDSLYSRGGTPHLDRLTLPSGAHLYQRDSYEPKLDPVTWPDDLNVWQGRNDGCAGSGGVTVCQPGHYISHVSISGRQEVELTPGVYYFEGGIDFSGNVDVLGEDVTIISEEGFSFTGNNDLYITAPGSGETAELALVSLSEDGINIGGNGDVRIEGIVYAPSGNLTFSGTPNPSNVGAACLVLIGQTIRMSGDVTLNNTGDCFAEESEPIVARRRSLVQ